MYVLTLDLVTMHQGNSGQMIDSRDGVYHSRRGDPLPPVPGLAGRPGTGPSGRDWFNDVGHTPRDPEPFGLSANVPNKSGNPLGEDRLPAVFMPRLLPIGDNPGQLSGADKAAAAFELEQ